MRERRRRAKVQVIGPHHPRRDGLRGSLLRYTHTRVENQHPLVPGLVLKLNLLG
jgi:hypothetical protein